MYLVMEIIERYGLNQWVQTILELEYTTISYYLIKHDNYKRVQFNLSDYTKFVRVCNLQQKRGILRLRLASFF